MKPYLNIDKGSHPTAQAGMCVMEAVAYFVGEKHTDRPECTCSVIGRAMIQFNDAFPFKSNAERTETLLPLIPVVVGTQGTKEDRQERAFIAADFAVRVFLKIRLEAAGRSGDVESLRALAPVVDKETAIAARDLARKIRNAAAAAAAYAYAYAYAAAAAAYAYAYAYAAYAADAYADGGNTREAIKLAFCEMIKAMAAVGQKKMEMTPAAEQEFQSACELVCRP